MEAYTFNLFPFEYESLLAALRRDMRTELDKASLEPHASEYHRINARMIKRVLEVLNPKSATRPGHEPDGCSCVKMGEELDIA